jgi:hypothetical protein
MARLGGAGHCPKSALPVSLFPGSEFGILSPIFRFVWRLFALKNQFVFSPENT